MFFRLCACHVTAQHLKEASEISENLRLKEGASKLECALARNSFTKATLIRSFYEVQAVPCGLGLDGLGDVLHNLYKLFDKCGSVVGFRSEPQPGSCQAAGFGPVGVSPAAGAGERGFVGNGRRAWWGGGRGGRGGGRSTEEPAAVGPSLDPGQGL